MNAQNPAVERDWASEVVAPAARSWEDGGINKRALDRVLAGPQPRALADCKEST